MAFYLLILLAIAGSVSALGDWRSGLRWMIVLSAVQDPLRKLVPGAPGTLLLLVSVIFLSTAIGLLGARPNVLADFRLYFPGIYSGLGWFLLACIPAVGISAMYGPGSWVYTLFGILSYASILFSVIIGFYYLRSERDLRQLLRLYCLLTVVALSGTFIEYFDLPGFGDLIGAQAFEYSWIRYNEDYTVNLLSGFYRSPDVMGWHAATTAILSLVLAFTGRVSGRLNWLAVTSYAVAALMVSGRRKMVFMIPFFIVITLSLLVLGRRRGTTLQNLMLIVAPLAIAFLVGDWLGAQSEFVRYYTSSGTDLLPQTQRHWWESVVTTFDQNGFWGLGLGFASPGAQNISYPRPWVWQESGLSRVMAEVGVPGLVTLLLLIGVIIRSCVRVVRLQDRIGSLDQLYAIGLLGFVLANFASLSISGQILADPFIASFIGIAIGMQLSFRRLALQTPLAPRLSVPAAGLRQPSLVP